MFRQKTSAKGKSDHGHIHSKHENVTKWYSKNYVMNQKTVQKKHLDLQFPTKKESVNIKHLKAEDEKLINEPVYAVTEKNLCTRCGQEFSQNHLAICKAKNEKCKKRSNNRSLCKNVQTPKSGNVRGRGNFG